MKPIYILIAIALTAACQRPQEPTVVRTTYYHKYGVEVPNQEDWMARGGTGEIVRTQKNGVVVRERYVDGVQSGETTATFAHSNVIRYLVVYDRGAKVAESENYPSGSPMLQSSFYPEEVVCVAYWYEDGSPRAQEEVLAALLTRGDYMAPDGEVEASIRDGAGTRVVRDGLGTLQARDTIANGELVLQETYHPNGTPSAKTPYVAGKVEGFKYTFHQGGEPRTIEEWSRGRLDGYVVYFQNGERIAQVPYRAGQRDGIEYRYRSGTDEVVEEISWSRDQKHGPHVFYVADGNKLVDWYFGNEKVNRFAYIEQSRLQAAAG